LGAALALRNRNSTQTWRIAVDATAVDDKKLAFIDGTSSTVRMTVTDAGAVGIGTTEPSNSLEVAFSAANSISGITITNGQWFGYGARLQFRNLLTSAGTVGETASIYGEGDGSNAGRLVFHTTAGGTASERARIDSSGRLLVGTSSFSGDGTIVARGSSAGSATQSFLNLQRGQTNPTGNLDLGIINFTDAANSIGASITAATDGSSWGASDYPTRLTFSTTADGASSPTERMRITNGGSVNIGSQGTDVIWNQTSVVGVNFGTAGVIQVARSNDTPVLINRIGNDGKLIVFAQDGAEEGDISVSGSTVALNGAHLSRWSQLPGGAERSEILRGTVLSNIDEMCEWGEEDNEQLNRMKVSDVEGDPNVSGVFQGWDNDDDTYTDDFYCAMTGDFIIRIAQGIAVQRGDLLMSAGDGTAKPQEDDIIRSKTIAKVTSTHVTCTYDDGSYCVPCVLMAC
jgi:hypothetical protein